MQRQDISSAGVMLELLAGGWVRVLRGSAKEHTRCWPGSNQGSGKGLKATKGMLKGS